MFLALSLLIFARPGPDTASRAFVAEPSCRVKLSTDATRCPERILCEIAHQLPDPGHTVESGKATVDLKAKRIRVDLKLKRKPGDWPQVIVPTKTTVDLGTLRKGRYVVEIHRDSRVIHAFLLDAR